MDFSDLISAVGENQGALVEMINDFFQICPDRVRLIQEAVKNQDGSNLEKKAHGFKSVVGIWGNSKTFDKLTELEEAGRQEDFSQAEKIMERLPGELENLNQELGALRDSLSQKIGSSGKER